MKKNLFITILAFTLALLCACSPAGVVDETTAPPETLSPETAPAETDAQTDAPMQLTISYDDYLTEICGISAAGEGVTVEGNAVLFLNKLDLIAFGDVRGENEKQAVYEITPDSNNPNTGTIKDGGLTVRYCLNSDCAALSASGTPAAAVTMFYGNPKCAKLDLFSPYEVTLLEERFADEGMLGINGDVQLGADVVVDKGFVAVKKPA